MIDNKSSLVNYIDGDFDSYINSISSSSSSSSSNSSSSSSSTVGPLGGYLELYSASKLYNIDIKVYQVNGPMFTINSDSDINSDNSTSTTSSSNSSSSSSSGGKKKKSSVAIAHVSYHGGCHYNSVRLISDIYVSRPAICSHARTNGYSNDDQVNIIIKAVPWLSNEHAEVALQQCYNNTDAAIELLIRDPDNITRLLDNDDDNNDADDNADYYYNRKPQSPISFITAPFDLLISSIGAVCSINTNTNSTSNSNSNGNGFSETTEKNFTSIGNLLFVTPFKGKKSKKAVTFSSTPPEIHSYSIDDSEQAF
jgi:hypothetical protein